MKKSAHQSGQAPNMCKHSSGQALLIILLVMAVGLTIGLSIVSRSITDIRISQQEEESARAFSAAEAGIEQVLIGGDTSGNIGGIEFNVTPETQGEGPDFDLGEFVEGDIQTVWLVEHNADGEPDPSEPGGYTGSAVDLYWGNEGQDPSQLTAPALEVTVIYLEGATYKATRGAFDPYSGSDIDRMNNGFDSADSGPYSVGGKNYQFRKLGFTLPTGTLYVLRLKLLYNTTEAQALGVSSGTDDAFPSQGACYVSTATVPESGITRKVQQCQFHEAPPGIFDYVLFSGGSLSK